MEKSLLKRAVGRLLGFLLFFLPLVFLLAGRLDYWQGWTYNATSLAGMVATLVLSLKNPNLVEERMKPGPGVPWWDRAYLVSSGVFFIGALILSALDAGRFGWSPPLSPVVYLIAYPAYVLGQGVFLWARTTNAWFSSMVRIQTDRDHQVCDSGPYAFVRHPGYVGGLLFMLATPLMLGSLWGLVPQVTGGVLLIIRTALEDRKLQKELPGYADYARRVRYRLVPGLW